MTREPTWRSLEPSAYDFRLYPEYGSDPETKLVAGLLGHNICLDLFGAPSPEEAAAGMPVHGEAPVALYEIRGDDNSLTMHVVLEKAQLRFERCISLVSDERIQISEAVENLTNTDRPIAWTQHVTLGSPFLQPGETQFLLSAGRSRVIGSHFNHGLGGQEPDSDFDWPFCPRRDGGVDDLRVLTCEKTSGGFTAHLMDQGSDAAYFAAWSPQQQLLFGYEWNSHEFPWLARWEENHLRTWAPWKGKGYALGLEFGVSPFVESRSEMTARGSMFGVPTFRWLPAKTTLRANYQVFARQTDRMPESVRG
jgi:hypothetical protein